MKFLRARTKANKIIKGFLEHDTVQVIIGNEYDQYSLTDESYSLEELTVLAPCEPSKILCLGLNYREHAAEMKLELPKYPIVFSKPSTAVIAPQENIVWNKQITKRVDFEAELAIVIGKTCKDVSRKDAAQYIFGYTCGNDVTARDLQPANGQWTYAKSFDTFCPLGPYIVTDIDGSNLDLQCLVNGEVKQHSNTANFIFPIDYVIEYLSQAITLLPGDVILTGTPSGIAPLNDGDEVCVVIENIGTLVNFLHLK